LAGWRGGACPRNLRQRLTRLRKSIGEAVVDDGQRCGWPAGGEHRYAERGQLLSTLHYDDCPEFDQWLSRCRCSVQAQDASACWPKHSAMIDAGRFGTRYRRPQQTIRRGDGGRAVRPEGNPRIAAIAGVGHRCSASRTRSAKAARVDHALCSPAGASRSALDRAAAPTQPLVEFRQSS